MELQSHTRKSAVTRAGVDAVYTLLADVPRSVAHFPELESITRDPGGSDRFVWRMKKLGAGPVQFQVSYAAQYRFDPELRSVGWESVTGIGNTRVSGRWIIEGDGVGTKFTLDTAFCLTAPFPGFLRGTAEALMARENDRLIGVYLENLKRTLDA